MLIAGVVLLVLAAAAGGWAWWSNRKLEELSAVETSTCGDMRQLADAVSVSAGGGAFRQRCELTGAAQPAYVGTVNAPQTGRECLWYRTKVTHEYYDYEYDHETNRRRREKKSHTMKDEKSDIPFALDDGSGQAVIHPDDASIDAPVQVMDQMDEDTGDPMLHKLIENTSRGWDIDESIGYKREEWLIPVGQQLFVQGEITDEDGHLRLRKPEKGPFRVSTRSEQELAESHGSHRKWSSAGAAVLGVVGLVLVVAGLLA